MTLHCRTVMRPGNYSTPVTILDYNSVTRP
jgi:hypothetical protein